MQRTYARLASGAAAAATGCFFAAKASSLAMSKPTVTGKLDEISERLTAIEMCLGLIVDPRKYIITGSPEAAGLDLDFDLTMDASLAKNEYPASWKTAAHKSDAGHKCLGAQVCTEELFEKYKTKVSSGPAKWTIARAVNSGVLFPESFVGCHAGDYESYDDFKEFFYPVIQKYHKGFDVENGVNIVDMDPAKIREALSASAQSKIISTRIRVARNLSMFPLNPGGSLESRLAIAAMMEKVYAKIEGDLSGQFFRHTNMTAEQQQKLVDDHFMFRGKDRMQAASGYHEHWPEGRGIFHNDAKTFINWLNEGDHLRIISMQQGGDVLAVFTRLHDGIKAISSGVSDITGVEKPFMIHPKFGNVTCCPSNLGSGMRGSVHILVPKLIAKHGFNQLDVWCRERNCQARGSSGEHSAVVDRIDVSNWRRIGYPEWMLVEDMIKCANFLADLEESPPTAIPPLPFFWSHLQQTHGKLAILSGQGLKRQGRGLRRPTDGLGGRRHPLEPNNTKTNTAAQRRLPGSSDCVC